MSADPTQLGPNAFTVDVEDYFHVQAFAGRIRRDDWDDFESRVVPNTHRILRLLDKHQTPGTFFILGWVAERHPELVRDIQKAGHEIGCHSYWHRLIYEQTPEEFRDDLRQATDVLQNITCEPVTAFRAPCFSVTRQSEWALDILIDEGYRLDSSIVPVKHDTYGMSGANPAAHTIERPGGTIVEVPPAVRSKWFGNIPVGEAAIFACTPTAFRVTCCGTSIARKPDRSPFTFIPGKSTPINRCLPPVGRVAFATTATCTRRS